MASPVTEPKHARPGLNWTLALLTVPGAAAVVLFMYIKILGTAGCSDRTCPRMGPGEVGFTLIQYGTPALALVTIVLSVYTARRTWGTIVPAIALALLVVAGILTAVSFSSV
jgi:hypothetical protein